MRRSLAATFVVGTLAVAAAAPPAGAQLPDVPPLGLTIDPPEGAVESEVSGSVSPEDVAEHCITDPREFVAQFVDPDSPLDPQVPSPYGDALEAWVNEVHGGDVSDLDPVNDPADFATFVSILFPVGLALDLRQGGELVDGAMEQTFVMAFADIASASPIDPLGSFDPTSGVGSVTVPELPAGQHPVIATCVGIPDGLTVADFQAAVDAGAAFAEANLAPPFPSNPLSPEFAELAAQVAPSILRDLVQPRALGFQFFCIQDATGECPSTPPGPGGPPGSGTPPAPQPATPVPSRPSFTG